MATDAIKALSPRDLAAVYIGTFQMLQDLNAVTRRLPGGELLFPSSWRSSKAQVGVVR